MKKKTIFVDSYVLLLHFIKKTILLLLGVHFYKKEEEIDVATLQKMPRKAVSSKGKAKICFYIGSLGSGGAERQLTALACELARRGHKVRVLVDDCSGKNGHYLSMLQQANIPVDSRSRKDVIRGVWEAVTKKIHKQPAQYLPNELRPVAFAIAHLLKKDPPDILHCYLDFPNICGALAGFMTEVPAIRLSTRSVAPYNYPNVFGTLLPFMQKTYKGLLETDRTSIEANSINGCKDHATWLDISPSQILHIPNGITKDFCRSVSKEETCNLLNTLCIPKSAHTVACVLRMTEEKRPLSVIEVARIIVKKYPEVRFLFAGSGTMQEEVKQLITKYGLEKNVLLLGTRSDVPVIIKAANALLLTSRIEGMPNVIIEAMFSGKPVVASNVGGVPDLITHGTHGYLYDKDDMAGMAQGLEAIFADPEKGYRMGAAGAQKVQTELTLSSLVNTMETQYQMLLKPIATQKNLGKDKL